MPNVECRMSNETYGATGFVRPSFDIRHSTFDISASSVHLHKRRIHADGHGGAVVAGGGVVGVGVALADQERLGRVQRRYIAGEDLGGVADREDVVLVPDVAAVGGVAEDAVVARVRAEIAAG